MSAVVTTPAVAVEVLGQSVTIADRHFTFAELSAVLSPAEIVLICRALSQASYDNRDFEEGWAMGVLSNKFDPAYAEAVASL